jgi:ribose-phosphate pyrophosphokinase
MSRSDANNLKIFAGRHSRELTERVCAHLDLPIGAARTTAFPDGELFVKLDEDVRGRDCFVVISTCAPVNDNLVELLIFLDCLRRASARRVTVVIPYFGYGRQDRKDEGRVPITAKLVANMITAAHADRILAIDLHAAQIQGFFDIPFDHLSATPVFLDHFLSRRDQLGDLCLVSPDVGNVKVSEGMANLLSADLAIIHKQRISGSQVTVGNLIGSVKDKTVLMFDDMISTAGTVCEAARLVMEKGARKVVAAATHPVLVGMAMQRLQESPISQLIVTNTIPLGPRVEPVKDRLVELCVGPLIGEAIHRIHHDRSISELFRTSAGPKR